MSRRKQHLPWRAAGTASEQKHSADAVVRETGWVFNNRRAPKEGLAEFVETGNREVGAYLHHFGLTASPDSTLVEIGAGIGRMTVGFTHRFGQVIACDLDAAFLERCREAVARYGQVDRLRTVHVPDGQHLALPDHVADVVFSYITLQHCHRDEALALAAEAVRVAEPGGRIALNFRTWVPGDVVLWPAGKVVRGLWRVPRVGRLLARQRVTTRVGWQANRLSPAEVLRVVGPSLSDVQLFRSPSRRSFAVPGTSDRVFEGVHPSHWWLIANVR
jgi:SAM-dependent methyltransferase